MNWVGGSRNRLVMKNDAKKQREFFEKRKMQQKLRNLGVTPPAAAAPTESSSGSMDLVTLFIVNQIASKKAIQDPPKVAVLGGCKDRSRRRRDEPLVLPMSPCALSLLHLAEGEPQCSSAQGIRKRKHNAAQGFRCRQLSPVLESAFSDNSASDYNPPITDQRSPFSSASPASSGQGMFPLPLCLQKQNQAQFPPLPRYSPPPWDMSVAQQRKFQPFSEPRQMRDSSSWSAGTNPPLFYMQTPAAAQPLFGSLEADETQERDHARHVAALPLTQPEDKEPSLDFILNPSESKQLFEGDVFRGFTHEEDELGASHFGGGESKICLTDETSIATSTPQIVPDSQRIPAQLSNCSDMNVSCLGCDSGPLSGCESSPSYSCGGGYLSSDSDDEECQHPCLWASVSSLDPAAGCSLGTRRDSQLGSCSPLLKSNLREDHKVTGNTGHPEEAHRNQGQQRECSPPQLPSRVSEMCRCKKSSAEVRDAQTQTARLPAAETCDASTQCSFVATSGSKNPLFGFVRPNADLLEEHLATGRQSDPTKEADVLTALRQDPKREGQLMKPKRDATPSSSSIIHKITAKKGRDVILQKLAIKNNSREVGEAKDESDGTPLMKDLSDGGMDEVSNVTGANIPPMETDTLQEIADIPLKKQE